MPTEASLVIKGARTHNLKNIHLTLPRNRLVVFTGPSGSGKSSLAFDTLYAEGQRRYVESLSAYARQFLSMMEKPDVDQIEGLSPAISIEQKSTNHNPRSTVGTVTEIYDYLRLLYARIGQPTCPEHGNKLAAQSVQEIVDYILGLSPGLRLYLLAPVVDDRKGEYTQLIAKLQSQGFIRLRLDGKIYAIEEVPTLQQKQKHTLEVVVDRIVVQSEIQQRLTESVETSLRLGGGIMSILEMDDPDAQPFLFSNQYACPICQYSIEKLEPRSFSFNNPKGACPDCDGLGYQAMFEPQTVVTNPHLSLLEGAIDGWGSDHYWAYQILKALSRHYEFDLDQPFQSLPAKIQKVLLYGSAPEKIAFQWDSKTSSTALKKQVFEGIIPNMTRRYRETDSISIRQELSKKLIRRSCSSCQAERLNQVARHVYIAEHSLPQVTQLSIAKARSFFQAIRLSPQEQLIAQNILKEIESRLSFLINVGLDYLTLSRSAETLSGGESQRIRLASQLGSALVGVMYVLDEPTIGLHQRDNARLIGTLLQLRDLGNTVIVVEHDEDTIRAADYIVDMGPKAGAAGGYITAQGTLPELLAHPDSLTGAYLSKRKSIPVPQKRLTFQKERVLRLSAARENNLKGLAVELPIGLLTCVTGVSGSGKSTLINHTLLPLLKQHCYQSHLIHPITAELEGLKWVDSVIDIDQSPIGRTPRSNPATYTGILTPIRELFAQTETARTRAYTAGRFSFNVKGGRCEACEGEGVIKVEMHFLPDIYVTCESCQGQRYNRETLEVCYKNKNIAQILEMSIAEALDFFTAHPVISKRLKTLSAVGLEYMRLGQAATTLSGGEAQRIKLSKELTKRDTGKTVYILDEPTTGLHVDDIRKFLDVIVALRDRGNTIIMIEHNLDVIKTADWLVDLGPEGGDQGGYLVAQGTPEEVAAQPNSYTGQFLKEFLGS